MVEVSLIDVNYLKIIADMYVRASIVFKCEPEEASVRKQRKICKWINKLYKEEIQYFPQKIKGLFIKNNNVRELMIFLKECQEQIRVYGNEKKRKFEKSTVNVDEDVKSALWEMLQQCYWLSVKCTGDVVEIVVEENPFFSRIIILKDAAGVPDNIENCMLDNLGLKLKQEEKRYCIYGEIEDAIEDTIRPFAMTFSDAEVKVEVYNGIEGMGFLNDPWDYLREISCRIYQKATIPGEYCNSLEKQLLPLIKELVKLEYWLDLPNMKYTSFAELKALTKKYGHEKIVALLSETEKQKPGSKKYNSNVRRIINLLCDKRCEPLWREIFGKIKDSQKEYPSKVAVCCSAELLGETRMNIQKLMEQHGYSGTYPDFLKTGSIRGFKLEESYGMSYFIGLEKHVAYRIHCMESLEETGYFSVQFLCGTALLKEKEQVDDIYSCLFNAKGRRLYHLVHYYVQLADNSYIEEDDLETSVAIAVKKAECIKLTKEEKKEYYGQMMPGIGMFLFWLIFGGGFFGIFLNLGLMLMTIIMFVIFGEYNEIPTIFTEIPWGWSILFSAIAFGGPMGLITALAKRK